jgi:class 3 adenylate cyclase
MKTLHTILIVDDNEAFLDALHGFLQAKHRDWKIAKAYTRDTALAFINNNPVDAVVTDWKLDKNNKHIRADEVIKAARAKDKLCLVLLISAHMDEIKNKFEGPVECVPDDYIDKAIAGAKLGSELAFKLEMQLARRGKHREAYTYARHIDAKLKEKYGNQLNETRLAKRWITTVFSDIRGFSKVAGALNAHPEVLAPFLEGLYQDILDATHVYDGVVDKFMGDGSMLLFGVLGPDKGMKATEHAINAVGAALRIRNAWPGLLDKFKVEAGMAGASRDILSSLDIGIGIHTDDVLVGIVSTEERDQFTALGDGVNMAKRFESFAGTAGKKGKRFGNILMSGTVESRVTKQFLLEKMPNVNLKNIGEKECWAVIDHKKQP